MFFGGARESTEHHIVIRGIDAAPFQALLEFTRTAQVLIGQENVISLLETADFLQFDRVKLLCEKFLERELHVSNCLGLMTYSQQFAFVELHASAMNVALTHWGDVMCQEEFKALPKETLMHFLKSDELFVPREDVVFDSIVRVGANLERVASSYRAQHIWADEESNIALLIQRAVVFFAHPAAYWYSSEEKK
uniref:BACK domain-containing protein n=1 Tax=Anas platyrhynchos TaxID=8839 RepID=A0A8B9TA82_ANAPL